MTQPKGTKKFRFIALLPEIYEKLIIQNWSHTQVCEWLRDEHDLNLFSGNGTVMNFRNYLQLYGDIKTARHNYEQAVLQSSGTKIEENWFEPYINSSQSKIVGRKVASTNLNNANEADKSKPSSTSLANKLGISKSSTDKPKLSAQDLLNEYNSDPNI